MDYSTLLLLIACVLGFFMAWGIGANDVANAMGTSVGAKALTLTQAILVAAIFESAGAFFAGGQVTNTIRGSIIDIQHAAISPDILIYGMLAALMAAGSWLLIASYFAWPVSTTHSIIGAIIGFATIELGIDAVHWEVTLNIALSWVITPFISGTLAFLTFRTVQFFILDKKDPVQQAKKCIPFYMFITAFIVSMITLVKGLKHIHLDISPASGVLYSILLGILFSLIGYWRLNRSFQSIPTERLTTVDYQSVEKLFAILMIFTACAMAFAHGSNDVANAIGPLAAIVDMINTNQLASNAPLPSWILLLGAVGIVTGLSTYGYRVIATVGQKITELTPSRGFSAELATASTVLLASHYGLPVSTTQTLVGAILGVGLARGIGALRIGVIANVFISWIITLPAGALLAIVFFHLLKFCLSPAG